MNREANGYDSEDESANAHPDGSSTAHARAQGAAFQRKFRSHSNAGATRAAAPSAVRSIRAHHRLSPPDATDKTSSTRPTAVRAYDATSSGVYRARAASRRG